MRCFKILFLFFVLAFFVTKGYAGAGAPKSNKYSLDHAFNLLLNIDEAPRFQDRKSLKSNYDAFVDELKLKQHRWNDNHRLLKRVFFQVHKEYLKKYVPYQSFQDLFETGTYGCLTGTALYAFLMDELGYEYEIIETNYHMFLLVNTDGHQYLIESTDPINGFVYKADEIESRIDAAMKQNKPRGGKGFSYDIYKSISYVELIGLQYYNTAVNSYNSGNLSLALYSLNEASRFDRSQRIKELLELIMASEQEIPDLKKVISGYDELSLILTTG
ncbi:hypothetical protein [Reichenbachiella sp. MALMAid0571]|uniref:hypothetical protein n=1 Tax=Reichenbachiella sp. MALMAid0571 TaxID=3143939 RepID=UPI0032DFA6AB